MFFFLYLFAYIQASLMMIRFVVAMEQQTHTYLPTTSFKETHVNVVYKCGVYAMHVLSLFMSGKRRTCDSVGQADEV